MHTEGPAPYNDPEYEGIFRSNSLFVGANSRKAVGEGRADYTPIFLSEIPLLFHSGRMKPSIALIQITPPDAHGFCSLGASVDCTRAALQHSSYIIGGLRVTKSSNVFIPARKGDFRRGSYEIQSIGCQASTSVI
jgi:acyl-CoA hydrolase